MSEKIGTIGKIKGYVKILIPVIVLVAIVWGIFKFIIKKKNGEEATVGETVKEGVAFVQRTVKMFNGK